MGKIKQNELDCRDTAPLTSFHESNRANVSGCLFFVNTRKKL